MGNIRKQSIVSTIIIYVGFLVGFLNTYLFGREGIFTTEEYGLIGMFTALGGIMYGFANMGMLATVYKFYPYYKDHLPHRKIDLVSWALLTCLIGFACVALGGYVLKDLVIRKYSENSSLLVNYYFWIFPFGLGLTIFSVLEAFGWSVKRSVTTNFLKETAFRSFITVLIVLYMSNVITSFDAFVKIFSALYILLALCLIIYLVSIKELPFSFRVSKVTRRYLPKMATLAGFVYVGNVVYISAQYIDTMIIASLEGMAAVGIFTFVTNISGIVQAPQRSIVSASLAVLSESWKNKDMKNIQRIYQRSSINLLLASMAFFSMIWLNYDDAIQTFGLKGAFYAGKWVFFCLGIAKIIDLGTGVNSQIIATSTFWRFEFLSGVILLLLMVPLNYVFVKNMGIVGAGISNIISFFIYNSIRIGFLYKKFNIQPFTSKTFLSVIVVAAIYFIVYFLFQDGSGILFMVLRCALFMALFVIAVFALHLTPDAWQLYDKLMKKKR